MGLEVHVLDLGDIELDTSFLVLALEPGQAQQVPTFGLLITGRRGADRGRHGLLEPRDHGQLHTHLHIDHAGLRRLRFPMSTTVVINRRELEYSASA